MSPPAVPYMPAFQHQLVPASLDPFGPDNCAAYSGAMAADFMTRGSTMPTGADVRARTNEPRPPKGGEGLSCKQIDAALTDGWGLNLETRYTSDWSLFEQRINGGQGAVLSGSYDVFLTSPFSASATFRDNHAVFVGPGWVVMDPLADGRGLGHGRHAYRFHGEAYPIDLLRKFAARLVLDDGSRLGDGGFHASFTSGHKPFETCHVEVRPIPPATQQGFWVYAIFGARITGRRMGFTKGFAGEATLPRLYDMHGTKLSLVRSFSGAHPGLFISSKYVRDQP
jgi:hypothetical protein